MCTINQLYDTPIFSWPPLALFYSSLFKNLLANKFSRKDVARFLIGSPYIYFPSKFVSPGMQSQWCKRKNSTDSSMKKLILPYRMLLSRPSYSFVNFIFLRQIKTTHIRLVFIQALRKDVMVQPRLEKFVAVLVSDSRLDSHLSLEMKNAGLYVGSSALNGSCTVGEHPIHDFNSLESKSAVISPNVSASGTLSLHFCFRTLL